MLASKHARGYFLHFQVSPAEVIDVDGKSQQRAREEGWVSSQCSWLSVLTITLLHVSSARADVGMTSDYSLATRGANLDLRNWRLSR